MNQENTDKQKSVASVTETIETNAIDPLTALQLKATDKLEDIGFIGIHDIIEAFKDRDVNGRLTTVIELAIDYWDLNQESISYRRSQIATMLLQVMVETAGEFTTVILQSAEHIPTDMQQIWNILCNYGSDNISSTEESELPVLNIAAVPMSLGGHFGMIAMDPVYWCLQPASPVDTICNQIRILFLPETVLFLRDESFVTEEAIAKVRAEFAANKLIEEAKIRKQMEHDDFQKQKEAAMAEFLEKNKMTKHSFTTHRSHNSSRK